MQRAILWCDKEWIIIAMKPERAGQFSLIGVYKYREGCGYGLQQGHLVLQMQWQPGQSEALSRFASLFQPMLDETLTEVPSSVDASACVMWLAKTLGTLLRNFKIATDRQVFLISSSTDSTSVPTFKLALPTARPASIQMGLKWLLAMVNEPPKNQVEAEAAFSELQKKAKPHETPSANQWRTIQAAYDTGYPVTPFTAQTICIGTGVYRRLFSSFVTDQTPMLSMKVAQNKSETASLLRAHGMPGSQNKIVRSLEEALSAAKEMGYPLVIKPNNKDRGEGVAADLIHEADLIAAYEEACKWSSQILVEKHQAGFTHRFSVIHNQVMRVAKHVAFGVMGDGHSSVEQLLAINALNIEQKKRAWRNLKSNTFLDDEALGLLAQYGLTKDSVPTVGQYVKLRRKDNVSAGGQRLTLDIGQQVHPDNIALALNAVRLIGLDFAGVDLITPDAGRSWRELPVTICEINGNPQLVARDDPDMYKRVLAHVMPAPYRVNTQMVVLPSEPSPSMLSAMVNKFSPPSSGAALSAAAGLWVSGQFLAGPFASGFSAARSSVVNPLVKKITSVLTLKEVLRHGLPVAQLEVVMLPWRTLDEVPLTLKKDYQALLSLIQLHATKTLFIKGQS